MNTNDLEKKALEHALAPAQDAALWEIALQLARIKESLGYISGALNRANDERDL